MNLPSGRTFDRIDVEVIRGMHDVGFISFNTEEMEFKSGRRSHIYVRGREDLTDYPSLTYLVGRKIATTVFSLFLQRSETYPKPRSVEAGTPQWVEQQTKYVLPCLIGVPVAGTTLAMAASHSSLGVSAPGYKLPLRFPFRVMRTQKKAYGAHRTWVDGIPDLDRHVYMTIDNVVTDGWSKFECFEHLDEDGYPVEDMDHIVLIDLNRGGLEKVQRARYRMTSCYNLLDIVYAYVELGLWTKDMAKRVEEEVLADRA